MDFGFLCHTLNQLHIRLSHTNNSTYELSKLMLAPRPELKNQTLHQQTQTGAVG